MERIEIEKVWANFSAKLRQFIRNRVSDEYYADEILQEVFIKIHSNMDNLKDTEKISGWVFQIARNAIIDFYREGKKPAISLDEISYSEPESEDNFNKTFEQDIIDMMKDLPDKYQQALLLTEYQGLSQKELAAKLNISLSGAKSRVQRARMHLKDMLMQCCHIEFDKYGNIIDYHPHTCCCCTPKAKSKK